MMEPIVGIVIVSHHPMIAEGVTELVREVTAGAVPVRAAGGEDAGALGATPGRILEAVEELTEDGAEEVLLFADLGSSVAACKLLLEQEAGLARRVRLVDAPIVEGAFGAVVAAMRGETASGCEEAAKGAGAEPKLG